MKTKLGPFAVIALASALVAGACGGGGKKAADSGLTPTTVGDTTTTAAVSASPAPDGVTSSTAPTATTAKTTASTKSPAAKSSGVVNASTSKTTVPKTGIVTFGGGATTTTAQTGPQPQPGGTISYLVISDVNSLDPVRFSGAGGTDGQRSFAIFGALLFNDPKDGDVKPGILESATSSDGVSWTLKVRDGVKFTDNTPFDAAAIKFNWQRSQDPANASPVAGLAQAISAMDASGQTLKVTLKQQNNQWLRIIGRSMNAIGSPTAINERGAGFSSNPVGAGPFLFKEWVRDDHLTVVRNPGYWDAPRPYVDQINFRAVTNESQRMNSFLAGEAQMMYTTQGDTAQTVRKSGVSEASVMLNGASVVIFNTTRPPFNDVRARRAVILNLDVVKFQKEVGNNGKDPVKTLFTPGSPFDDGTEINPYNPAESQRLLDQLAAEKGGPLTFTFLAFTTSFSTATSEWLQAQFQNVKNIKVNIEKIASPAGQARVLAKNYDASPWGFGFSDPEPTLSSSFLSTSGPTNATGFSDSTLDAALMKGRNTFDVNERIAAYKTVTRILAEQSPVWWDDRSSFYNLGSKQLQDMRVYEDGIMRWDVIWFQK